MWPIVTDVAWSVGLSVTVMSLAKTAELIEMPFGVWTRVGPRKHALGGGVLWRNLANTMEPSICGGDAAFCQITLTTCLMYCAADACHNRRCENSRLYSAAAVRVPVSSEVSNAEHRRWKVQGALMTRRLFCDPA